ncbi:MAG: PilT/PilU family type 4a pilus ATPase [Candidatus Cloacimonetes bacterium]|jgi:twitching motility protein PilT|nr:PilT/PilU family type 4a pilus ATPase [Candidatus Cloacimonadota bacterium]MDD2506324.1 PilT/PilU family type 4a pilus ATPase [Candidatus Cloacimonadota bacterium]MDD4560108.1 PilT/PilU family type 4a pilus ATPase [Candidatus Cloacimonadota bacterium]
MMRLSFTEALSKDIPSNYQGVEVCEIISQWLLHHSERENECRDLLKYILRKAREMEASDVDLGAPGCSNKIWMRVFGNKKPVEDLGEFSLIDTNTLIISWLSPAQRSRLFMQKSLDFPLAFDIGGNEVRFRGTAFFDRNALGANFRRINDNLLVMEQLGIPEVVANRMNLRYEKTGLVLITGITGSGKSTTLNAIIDMNNRQNNGHIVSIDSPIEYVHHSKNCLVRHREVGVDVLSFEHGAVEALRQDPDIIVVGEMRDPQTIATVLEITDSGHKAFTTLHTSSAIDSVHRIVAEFPTDSQERVRNRLADVLTVCMSQKLVPTTDGKLTLAKEILSVDSSVQAAIRNKNIGEIYQMMVEGKKLGMCTLEQDLKTLYQKGHISQQTALNYANNKKRMHQLMSVI